MLVRAAVVDEAGVDEEVKDAVELDENCVEEVVVIVGVVDKEAVDEDVDADVVVDELGAEVVESDAAEVADALVTVDAVEEERTAEEGEADCDVDDDDTAGLEAAPSVALVVCAAVEDIARLLDVDAGILAADEAGDEVDVDDIDTLATVLLLEAAEIVVVGVTVLVVRTVTTGVV